MTPFLQMRGISKRYGDLLANDCIDLGIEGGEIMSLLQVAKMGGLPYTALRDATFAHPTLAESLNNLFAKLGADSLAALIRQYAALVDEDLAR